MWPKCHYRRNFATETPLATEADDIKTAKELFAASADMWSVVRQEALDDLQFARLSDQWPEEDKRNRRLDGRPCMTVNRLPAFIRQVVNDARQNKPQIKVRPVDGGADVRTADIFSGIIRNIESVSSSGIAYDTGIDMAVSCGFGFWRIDLEYVNDFSFDLEPRINRIANPLTVYFDPNTQAADSSDWKNCFVAEMMPKAEFEATFPDAQVSGFDDDDKNWPWVDEPSNTIRVAEWWRRTERAQVILQLSNGEVVYADEYEKPQTKAMFDAAKLTVVNERKIAGFDVTHQLVTGAEVLGERTEWIGKYIPIIPVYGEDINVAGRRHFRSMIRDAKESQRMVNFWRTTTTELVALAPKAPWVGKVGAFETDAEKWATANTRTHATLEYDGAERPQREPFDGVPAGALQESLNASDDMKAILGVFDASLGRQSNETSGRAIIARQRESDTGTFNFIDNLSRAVEHTGRVLVDIIPKLYKEPKIMRILGEDGKSEQAQIAPLQGQPPPVDENGIPRIYDLNAGKYDVTVQAGPSYSTRRDEAANQIVQVMQAYPPSAVVLAPELMRNLDMPNSDKIARAFEAMMPPPIKAAYDGIAAPQEGPPPEVQAMQAKLQFEQQAKQMQVQGDIQAQQAKTQADAQAKAMTTQADIMAMREKNAAEIQMMREKAAAEAEIKGTVALVNAAKPTPFQ